MALRKLKLNAKILLRIILVAVAFFVLLVALLGHFWSDWTHRDKNKRSKYLNGVYRYHSEYNMLEDCAYKECPDIGMERFYLVTLLLSMFGAFGSVVLEHFNTKDNKWMKVVDFIIHVVLGFLLFVGMITFLVSTLQVMDYFRYKNDLIRKEKKEIKNNPTSSWFEDDPRSRREIEEQVEYEKYYQWIIKILAVIFGLVVVVLHVVLAVLIGKPLFKQGGTEKGASGPIPIPSQQEAEVKSETV